MLYISYDTYHSRDVIYLSLRIHGVKIRRAADTAAPPTRPTARRSPRRDCEARRHRCARPSLALPDCPLSRRMLARRACPSLVAACSLGALDHPLSRRMLARRACFPHRIHRRTSINPKPQPPSSVLRCAVMASARSAFSRMRDAG